MHWVYALPTLAVLDFGVSLRWAVFFAVLDGTLRGERADASRLGLEGDEGGQGAVMLSSFWRKVMRGLGGGSASAWFYWPEHEIHEESNLKASRAAVS
jgi:hypothetical protein